MTVYKRPFLLLFFLSICYGFIIWGCGPQASPGKQTLSTTEPAAQPAKKALPAATQQPAGQAPDDASQPAAAKQAITAEDKPSASAEIPSSQEPFSGEFLNKVDASNLLSKGLDVEILASGGTYFDFKTEDGKVYRVETPIKPKYIERYINEYGFSDERIQDGLEPGLKGNLKASNAPENIMGVGPGEVIGVTPEASDGVEAVDVMPLFTLTTPPVAGPNDKAIREEMDYDPNSRDSSNKKRWFEIFRGNTKGVIWTIFEQSNRYFTMVDKREWDRYSPGKIFDLMQKFEYMVPIPDRILSGRNPKVISDEEKQKNRYVLHDYSFGKNVVRVLIPTYQEFDRAAVITPMQDKEQNIGFVSINTVLSDAEMADGEKFTWNVPIKVVISVNGDEYPLYMPSQTIIDINGTFYKLPKNLIHY